MAGTSIVTHDNVQTSPFALSRPGLPHPDVRLSLQDIDADLLTVDGHFTVGTFSVEQYQVLYCTYGTVAVM